MRCINIALGIAEMRYQGLTLYYNSLRSQKKGHLAWLQAKEMKEPFLVLYEKNISLSYVLCVKASILQLDRVRLWNRRVPFESIFLRAHISVALMNTEIEGSLSSITHYTLQKRNH